MVWWAEPATPAVRAARRGTPGEILSLDPLVIATGDGALELTRTEWRTPTPLTIGHIFPSTVSV
jgi:methionyl-tRNA formyltransferase